MAASTFISYSHHDRAVAEALCAALEASGTACWIAPRDIAPSREWAEEIIDGINAAQVMLLVFSSHSNGSPQVRREIERAIHKEIPVIPFRIENVTPTRSMEYFLSTQHWFDAFDEPVAAYLPRLCRLIATLRARNGDDRRTPGAAGITAADSGQPFSGNPYALQTEAAVARSTDVHVAAPARDGADAGSAASTTSTTSTTGPAGAFPESELVLLESQLAAHIGPIARLLVRRAAARSPDRQSLLDALAGELDQPLERTAFVTACRQRLGH